MATDDKRDALRVPCDYSIRVYGQLRELAARMVDISRTGVRIRVPLSRLMNTEVLDYASLTHSLEQVLGKSFQADLHHEMLGPLVRKRIRVMRVGNVDPDADFVEIGGRFDEPLTDDETVMLGVGLPPVGVTAVAAFQNVPAPTRRGDEGAGLAGKPRPKGYEGILHPSDGYITEPLVGSTEGVLGVDCLLAIPIERIPGGYGADQLALLVALGNSFGPTPRLEVLDGLHMVWKGGVQLVELELPDSAMGDALLLLRATS